jgi:hypothetical protein
MKISRIAAAVGLFAGAAAGDVMPFTVFENGANAPLIGLSTVVEVTASGPVLTMEFRNESGVASVVTALYIEGSQAAMAMLTNPAIVSPQMAGVDFVANATPPSPPGSVSLWGGAWEGNLFSLRASGPAVQNGLGPGESVSVRFDLSGSVGGVVQAIAEGDMRLVQHVQAIGGGQSVWSVSIPAPGASVGLLGSAAVMMRRRRRL